MNEYIRVSKITIIFVHNIDRWMEGRMDGWGFCLC